MSDALEMSIIKAVGILFSFGAFYFLWLDWVICPVMRRLYRGIPRLYTFEYPMYVPFLALTFLFSGLFQGFLWLLGL